MNKFLNVVFKRLIAFMFSFLLLFTAGFQVINAAGPNVIRSKDGKVLYELRGSTVYKGSYSYFSIGDLGTRGNMFGARIRRTPEGISDFDIVDLDIKGPKSYSSNYFALKTSHRGKLQVFMKCSGGREPFLEFDGHLPMWKIAVFICNKLQREAAEAAAETKALEEDEEAGSSTSVYTGQLHDALAMTLLPIDHIKQMVQDHPDWIRKYDSENLLPIHIAVKHPLITTELLQFLIDNGADVNSSFQDPELIAMRQAMPDLFSSGTSVTTSLLSFALENQASSTTIDCLLDNGATCVGGMGDPMCKCASNGVNCIGCFIRHGFSIDSEDSLGRTPLLYALGSQNMPYIKSILQENPNINHIDHDGDNAFHFICKNKKLLKDADINELFTLLIDAGVDVNKQDNKGRTPLHSACLFYSKHCDGSLRAYIIRELVKRGADPNIADNYGITPLHFAVYPDHPRWYDPDDPSNIPEPFNSLLMFAGPPLDRHPFYEEVVRALINAGANRDAEDKAGRKPVDYNTVAAYTLGSAGCCTIM